MTAVDMLKLEKLEIGGLQGRALNQHIQMLHQEFVETYKTFTEKQHDCLDLNNKVLGSHEGFINIPTGE